MARTLIARLPCLTRTDRIYYTFCIYVFVQLFSFSVISDLQSLKIENENNSTKTLTAEAPFIGLVHRVQLINTKFYLGWLELPLTRPNFHGPKPV